MVENSEFIRVARASAPVSTSSASLSARVRAAALAAGFDLCGIAGVEPSARLALFPQWVESGHAGEMNYLARRNSEGRYLRQAIREAWPWARSVICVAVLYNTAYPRSTDAVAADPGRERGWISRYCWSDDYHATLRRRLESLSASLDAELRASTGAGFRITVDTAPVVEREAAVAAGLGWQGKNTCLIHPRLGSFLFLGTIITSLDLESDSPLPDRCGSCTRCIEACPTQALAPYQMNASRCIAYLNLELRGSIPEPLRPLMGVNVLGCDICQDVCPWNRKAPATSAPEFQPRSSLVAPALEELASLDPQPYQARFRNSAAKRAKFSGLQRNVAVAMGNSGNPAFLPRLQQWAASGGVLGEHAAWAIRQIEVQMQRYDP